MLPAPEPEHAFALYGRCGLESSSSPAKATRQPTSHQVAAAGYLVQSKAMNCVCIFLLYLAAVVSSQAPGDEDQFCLDISTAPAYAPSVKPLMDSWRYRSLLGQGGVWYALDRDGTNGDGHNVSLHEISSTAAVMYM